jgi:biopolymer transport protein ExbD
MAKRRSEESDPKDESFGLSQPSIEFDSMAESIRSRSTDSAKLRHGDSATSTEKQIHDAEIKYRAMGWKGLDDDDEIPEEVRDFSLKKEPIPEDEMDMTPMVDVTFLLLIFFMVTASFTMQKSIEQPRAAPDDPAPMEQEILEDYIEIAIDQNNNYYVTSPNEAEREAPSEREMRAILSDAKANTSATRLVIKAHLDCKHSRVITAWDAGVMVGMNKIEIKTTEQDY